MRYMLDTNICAAVIKRREKRVLGRFDAEAGRMCVSTITLSEILFGAEKKASPALDAAVRDLAACIGVVAYDEAAASHYGQLRAELERLGATLGANDLFIAAHARSLGLILVTDDAAFERVPGLRVENWLRE
ncbi:PIN domain-containing protein [Methylocystis bryophila]|uniref:Ribonuclease VapC n=1 Tax=Methylocystis bryophila TaxID=655015 RepID=A0A1W6MWP0_9HYPH|nr:PIN domain-containing protein [Methylocystis bryophila]ARN82007.1 VapC toxin family PIN domain ribonuclease [Methylocystis bryophila]BDV38117.1 ribonuclease VapC [Methylocystis bryophila]